MAGRLPIGVCLPTIGAEAGWFLDAAARLEAAGYDGIWCWDHFMPRGDGTLPVLEAWSMLAAVAARTSRVRIGSLVLDVTKRHPALVAKAAATVQAVSGGRLVLGMGIGGFAGEHAALGIPFPPAAERAVLLDEGIATIRALWSGEPVTRRSVAADLRGARLLPAPRPAPPILVGAQSLAGVRLAARAANGWAAASTSFQRLLPAYLDALVAAGRDRAAQEVLIGMPEGRAGRDNIAGTPWATNPRAELARWLSAGADGVILMPRTPADVDALVAATGDW
jgi:alkanesulfonate monooxygenase SsuD/methylene tetrahydromethanopterin reductase-like flavin-dependent oxidoreductase (luciferase family)